MVLKVFNHSSFGQFQNELTVLDKLKDHEGFPKVISAMESTSHKEILMSYLGKDMTEMFKNFNCPLQKANYSLVFQVFIQLIKRLQTLHEVGYVHNDLKPENILISSDFSSVYLIDFGLAKPYLNDDGSHKPQVSHNKFSGNGLFCSYNAFSG